MAEIDLARVAESERITRYINEKRKIKPSTGTVRHNAFMPPPSRSMSVYRTTDLALNEIWEIGDRFVRVEGKRIIAIADIGALEIFKQHLSIEIAPDPHPRHANIIDWPEDESLQELIAIQLALSAQLTKRD